MENWWKIFFDEDYLRIWGGADNPSQTEEQARIIWELLELHEGSRVLDAPCGYGRFSVPIARMGATVVGVDQSSELLAHAETQKNNAPPGKIRYYTHDLREALSENGFDAAFNVFSSIGYSTDQDDLKILHNLANTLRPGGRLLVDTAHRDTVVAKFSRGARPAQRLDDGTLVIEEPTFDAITGRVNTSWYWHGPSGHGQKSASLRLYTATEIVAMLTTSGLRFISAYKGLSKEPFKAEGPDTGGRIAIVTERQ